MENEMMQQQGQQQPVTLTLNDIATAVQLVDVCSRRGAFQGNELAGVGMLRNKLELYVQQNAPEGEAGADRPVNVDLQPSGPMGDKVVG